MAIGSGHPSVAFNAAGIASAPSASGVYAIYNSQRWIYVGESNDIQRRLGEHFAAQGTCIKDHAPAAFQYELVAAAQRVARQDALIVALNPACVERAGA
jgi:predicted GIY-YIG superfamily endonuclease